MFCPLRIDINVTTTEEEVTEHTVTIRLFGLLVYRREYHNECIEPQPPKGVGFTVYPDILVQVDEQDDDE